MHHFVRHVDHFVDIVGVVNVHVTQEKSALLGAFLSLINHFKWDATPLEKVQLLPGDESMKG